ncbi:hypothetical protein H6P81_002761 [Aristolochia fimbriata]|uniref:Aminotransferase-like plant mobile domain-containing protein n=1 Tax=Aristolochia fimbriata TaxID=158543 RepID=A0AAV7FF79_ARIFI|nr:hypothetical protein H6P81_002761 [Aristolochia fimbriata]
MHHSVRRVGFEKLDDAMMYTLVRTVMMADTLLYDQASHRSEAILRGEMNECLLPYIEAAGFGALVRVQWLRLDKPLITSLVERWRRETNTFYLAYGEMTIALEDVSVL